MNVTGALSFLLKLFVLLAAKVKGNGKPVVYLNSEELESVSAGTCKPGSEVTSIPYSDTIVNHTIVGPVMSSIHAKNERECETECHLADPDLCYMINYHPSSKMCELLYKDRAAEYNVKKKDGSTFKTRKCISNPCLPLHTCFTLGDQTNNSCIFNEASVWTQWTSWTACHLPDCPSTRKRICTKPAGTNCSGPALDTKACSIPRIDTTRCDKPLGMEDRSILDSQITASSMAYNKAAYAPQGARLNNQNVDNVTVGAWVAGGSMEGEYIQVDLGEVKMVTKFSTQGRPSAEYSQWVTEYSVSYSNETNNWTNYQGDCVKKFKGNNDADTVVSNKIIYLPIIARYIRVIIARNIGHCQRCYA